jgi:hypothetical protein
MKWQYTKQAFILFEGKREKLWDTVSSTAWKNIGIVVIKGRAYLTFDLGDQYNHAPAAFTSRKNPMLLLQMKQGDMP